MRSLVTIVVLLIFVYIGYSYFSGAEDPAPTDASATDNQVSRSEIAGLDEQLPPPAPPSEEGKLRDRIAAAPGAAGDERDILSRHGQLATVKSAHAARSHDCNPHGSSPFSTVHIPLCISIHQGPADNEVRAPRKA